MRMRTLGMALTLSGLAGLAHAEGFAIAAKAGSTGIGAEFTFRLTSKLNARLGGGKYNYSYDGELSDVRYSSALDLSAGSAALDWHPTGGAFRVSGGVMRHGNKLSGVGTPLEDVDIGNNTYRPSQVGTLSVSADYGKRFAPFATLGFGNGARGKRVFLSFDAGVAFTGNPAVHMTATGSAPGLASDLRLEEQNVNSDLRVLKIYPIVSLGLGFRF